jgi:hypothetical protein
MGEPGWADNWTVDQGGLLMEIMETATRNVWLCHSPVTADRYRSLGLPDGFVTSGLGRAVADVAYFRRPPGAGEPGPLEVLEVDGLRFAHVARPGPPEGDIDEALVLPVDKHHSMLYAAGRTIEVLDFGDGSIAAPAFAPARRSNEPDDRRLPDGWSLRSVTLDADLVVEVPRPARVAILGDGSGFHGPLSPDLVA